MAPMSVSRCDGGINDLGAATATIGSICAPGFGEEAYWPSGKSCYGRAVIAIWPTIIPTDRVAKIGRFPVDEAMSVAAGTASVAYRGTPTPMAIRR